MGQLISYL